ncbi:DUF305 domain-containing protein [Nocardioides sp.]|uniref:DUF305 domain-containing protein n=1 Tax=Nocardioides sp. TaxID=35761 RepID=UPI002ED8B142
MATPRQPARRRALTTRLTAAVGTGLALAALAFTGCDTAVTPTMSVSAEPAHNQHDVAFAAEMVPHHEQGLRLVALAADRDVTAGFAALTAHIETGQSADLEQLTGWLTRWDEPTPTAEPMDETLLSQRSATGALRGLVRTRMGPWALSAADVQEVRASRAADFEDRWLRTMIVHHQGAISMARHEIAQGEYPPAVALAEQIVTTQQAEVEEMRRLLRE